MTIRRQPVDSKRDYYEVLGVARGADAIANNRARKAITAPAFPIRARIQRIMGTAYRS